MNQFFRMVRNAELGTLPRQAILAAAFSIGLLIGGLILPQDDMPQDGGGGQTGKPSGTSETSSGAVSDVGYLILVGQAMGWN